MSCTFTIIPQDGSSGNYVEEGNYWLLNFDQSGNEIGRKKEGNERLATVWISLDGSTTNNSFYQTETRGSWFDVERKRNEIIIRVQPNFTTEERDGYVEYAHNCDASKTCQICIHQCPTVYQISAGLKELEFESWNKEDSREIAVTTKGGSGRFYVKSVKQYQENGLCVESKEVTTTDSDGNETTSSECTEYMDLQVEYDDGLKLVLEQPEKCVEDDSGECPNCTGNGTLTIKSCGRTFVDEDNYYIITLAHLDYRFATCEIRVEYALPARSVVMDPDAMEFDYLGRGADTAEIMFQYTENGETKEFPDYGYEYEITTDCCDEDSETEGSDCVDCSWLTITENPTSLSFSCELNPTTEDRSVEIKVCSVDKPDSCATMTVTQEGYRNYAVVLSDAAISFSFDDTTAKTISVYLYAGQTSPSKLEDILAEVDCDWLDVAIGAVTEEELYTEVEVSIAPKGEYTDTDKTQRDCNVTFKHPLDDNSTTTIQVIQFAEGQDSSIVQGIIGEYSDGQIIIPFIPASSEDFTYYLIASSTATWCSATIGGNDDLDVILKCTPNYWKSTRYCVVTVTDTINSTVYRYKIEQEYCDENATDSECDPYEFSVTPIEEGD